MSKARPQRETVKHLTYFVVQTYSAVKGGGINADDPKEARNRDHALQLFERYKSVRAGVIAFHRSGDPKTGDYEDAVIIARYGSVPAAIDNLVDETDIEADRWDLGEADLKVA